MDKKNKTFLIVILLYSEIIAGVSLTPVPPITIEIPHLDKVIHVLLYIPLGFLLSFPKSYSIKILNFFIPLASGAFYGGALELLQNFVPGRTCSWGDAIANTAGVGIGLAISLVVNSLIHKEFFRQVIFPFTGIPKGE